MKQNIYDDPQFFAGYSQLRRHESGLNAAIDQPAMRSVLPPLAEKRVLDLGCGFGKMCRYAVEQGAASVVGVDISTQMLAKAREDTADPRISYLQSALEDLSFAPASFDVVVSSLALHYVERFDSICANVKAWLAAGGAFVFSVEHPMVTAYPVGRYLDAKGEQQHWLIDNYKLEGIRHTQWIADDVKDKLTAGSYVIFKGPVADNTGKTVIAAGVAHSQTDPELEKMNYLVDGVIGATS